MSYVRGWEAGYLRMIANRVLSYAQKSKDAGEMYHDLTKPITLTCGHKARIFFEFVGGREPVAYAEVHPTEPVAPEVLVEIASELLREPAEMVRAPSGDATAYLFRAKAKTP